MINKATILRLALMLTLTNAFVTADLMAGLPSCFDKEDCHCESPIFARCDDYCSKLFPCVTDQPGCRRCDDYCRKGIPCIPCRPRAYRCNDYCRKCAPLLCPIRMICPGSASSCGEGEGCGSAGTSCGDRSAFGVGIFK